jgi:hypothetical protein
MVILNGIDRHSRASFLFLPLFYTTATHDASHKAGHFRFIGAPIDKSEFNLAIPQGRWYNWPKHRPWRDIMKFVNQRDYPHWLYVTRTDMEEEAEREKGKTTTVASSACGLCSAVMVADRLLPNCEFDLKDALELSYEVKANYKRGTNYARFAPAFAEKLGLKLEMTRDIDALINCLRTGGAAVFLAKGDRDGQVGLFTHGAHYVAVINEEPDGRFAILDPSYNDTKFEEPDRVGKVEIKNNVIVLCDEQTLEHERPTWNSAPYYLFWRK